MLGAPGRRPMYARLLALQNRSVDAIAQFWPDFERKLRLHVESTVVLARCKGRSVNGNRYDVPTSHAASN